MKSGQRQIGVKSPINGQASRFHRVKLLALGCSVRGHQDPIDGEYRYKNLVRIYNLETGESVGEKDLPGDRHAHWEVEFSDTGRSLRVATESSAHVFELAAQ